MTTPSASVSFLKKSDVKRQLRLLSAQINTRVGDVDGNLKKILKSWDYAEKRGVDLVVTPELSLSGYPLEDLVENEDMLNAAQIGLERLKQESKTRKSAILVGLPIKGAHDERGRNIYNAAMLIENGEVKEVIRKHHLPNYDVFDEARNFASGYPHDPFEFRGCKLGVMICEDTWYPDVAKYQAEQGAQVLVSMNSSPFDAAKYEKRLEDVVRERVIETGLPMLYVNQVGGQDEIVFDGASFALNATLQQPFQAPMFDEAHNILTLDVPETGHAQFQKGTLSDIPKGHERVWRALVQGLKDYLAKIGQKEVILGMSGGIDSAVVAAIAADAIGGENVHLVSMPSKYTADISNDDAYIAADMLDAHIFQKPIEPAVQSLRDLFNDDAALNPGFKQDTGADVSDENLQSRIRGVIIMRYSNKFGWFPLSTGNKSEVSVGYCTLYGDMNGGFNPLKDVKKTLVYDLAKWRNENTPKGVLGPDGPVMPERIITRPPSAELAEGQEDQDSLPDYDTLDAILEAYVERDMTADAIEQETGFDRATIDRVIGLTDIAEFKRRQACPGVKITPRSFGRGRRYPIARPTTPRMLSDLKR